MKNFLPLLCCLSIFTFSSCGGWTDERKKIITDKCDEDLYDCNCYLQKTIESFPEPDQYNTTLENEAANQQKVDAYWNSLLEGCMK